MSTSKNIAVIQVRMGSTRLPGKAMLNMEGYPILWWVIRQIKGARLIDRIVVATTTGKPDDVIEHFCRKENVICYRGRVDNIVDRIYHAVEKYRPFSVVRITADDMFKDPEHLDLMLTEMTRRNADVAVNNQPPSYPFGMDMDIVKYDVLEKAFQTLKGSDIMGDAYIDFVTDDNRFSIFRIKNEIDLSHHRWTIDYPDDYAYHQKIIQKLIHKNIDRPYFIMQDILEAESS